MNKNTLPTTTATSTEASNALDPTEIYFNSLSEGISLYQVVGLKEECLEDIYKVGYDFFSFEEYEQAIPFFKILTIYNQADSKGWMSLAACYQYLTLYQEAINTYSFAILIDPNNPNPPFYLGQCCLALNETEQAFQAFQKSLSIAKQSPSSQKEYQSLIAQTEALLEEISSVNF